jgi:hypothetical protein
VPLLFVPYYLSIVVVFCLTHYETMKYFYGVVTICFRHAGMVCFSAGNYK